MERSEYLQRPLIEDVVYEISENKIQIASPQTSFIYVKKENTVLLSELEQLFRNLKKEAKGTEKLKIKGVSKFLPTIHFLYPSYCMAIEQMNQYYSEITEIAHKIKSDGLHYGCYDDELYKEALEKQNEIRKFYYRSSKYSQYLSLYHRIQDELTIGHWKNNDVIKYVITLI